jgi:hypothetical protein
MKARQMFDTLKYSKELQRAGMEPAVADAQAKINADFYNLLIKEQIATKEDINALHKDINFLRHKMTRDTSSVGNGLHAALTSLGIRISLLEAKIDSLKHELRFCILRNTILIITLLGGLQIFFYFIEKMSRYP